MKNKRIKQGFTLIELLVVVLIIGILAAVALPQYNLAVAKSRYTQLLTAGNAMATATRVYYLENGVFPSTLEELDYLPFEGTLSEDKRTITSGSLRCRFNWIHPEFICEQTNTSLPTLVLWGFPEGKRDCRARNEFEKKVCVGVGGVNPDEGTSWTDYTLP